ncbi:uncharacterized protein [Cicer arietinum]|uniref:Uncharacterized protein LOC101513909 n=1 Tax=Cicer arietinum TaxID=3827 RepID=A0A1S2XYQ3_CICAR|nr:uncharacterized protein LOC101513909 [Cicer arietinum]
MECNKDEAVRAKQVAESRIQRGEFVEALKFANKAKKLYPDVENIAQILAVCEVHKAAQNKLSGSVMDWYGILQTERLSEEAIIKKQYRKLALLLHPDKNKFAGAEAAFKLIVEANGVLSDQANRSLYDMKLKVHPRTAVPKTSSHQSNGNVSAAKHVPNVTKSRKKCSSNFPSWNPHLKAAQPTFWTTCKHCNTRFNFYTTFFNMAVLCPKCRQSFVAHAFSHQAAPPFVSTIAPNYAPMQAPPKPASRSNGGNPLGGGWADAFVQSYPSFMKTCVTGVGKQQKGEKNEDGHVPVLKTMDSQTSKYVGSKRVRQAAPDLKESFNTGNVNEKKDVNVRGNDVDPSILNVRRSSRQKQHVSYVEKSEVDNFDIPSKKPRQNGSLHNDEVQKKNASEETFVRNTRKDEHSHVQGDKVFESDLDPRTLDKENCSPLNSNVPSTPEVIHCPDPDFNDFDKDRAEGHFGVNQVWAIYDSTDAMPRFYALVKKVASPFKLQFTWLEPNPDDQGEADWHYADLPIACGKFKLGDSQKTTNSEMFSHQIQCIKRNGKSSYLVFPNKGETWAIFRNWDIKWSSNPENYLKREFAYVEILSDFAENVGIEVAYLSKVKGFVSLFEKTGKNGDSMLCIPPNELYRFSHRIPSYKMSGDEREGVPRGCFELDPAALPTNFDDADCGDVNTGVPARE